jgi:hypothetical protein
MGLEIIFSGKYETQREEIKNEIKDELERRID